jgi:integrase
MDRVRRWLHLGGVPQPYNRTELRALQSVLDQRWPKLPREEAEKWLQRYKDGRSPYSRVRVHAISCQLDAIVSLSLHLGLRRSEIFRLTVDDAHPYNAGVLVRHRSGDLNRAREVPWTSRAHFALERWIKCRFCLGAEHGQLWLNLHSAMTADQPMTSHTFNRLLGTYLGPEWTFSRLRVTAAVSWARCGLPLERLRELLGLARIEDVLPYARLAVTGSLERDIDRFYLPFIRLVQEVPIAA